VQGLGAMGAAVVRYFSETGAILKAVSDPRVGGTFLLRKSPTAALLDAIAHHHWEDTKKLLAVEAQCVGIDEVLYQPVDVLFPAAIQDVISSTNVARIQAKRVVEAANNPCTAEARTALHNRGVLALPDFIVNAGGIIAAYVEMSSSVSCEENARTRKNCEDAKVLTRQRMRENTSRILEMAREAQVAPSVAGRYLALSNIFKN
jgi:glutamate dehydrogenase (NAD(P)+)